MKEWGPACTELRPPTPRVYLSRAAEAIRKGATWREACAKHKVSSGALSRYLYPR